MSTLICLGEAMVLTRKAWPGALWKLALLLLTQCRALSETTQSGQGETVRLTFSQSGISQLVELVLPLCAPEVLDPPPWGNAST